MNKTEIIQRVANDHNILADIMVKGDGAIAMGTVLEDLRMVASQLQADIQAEAAMAAKEVETE